MVGAPPSLMLCGIVGMVLGGFLLARTERLERIIAVCMLGSALMLCITGAGLLSGMASAALASSTLARGVPVGMLVPIHRQSQ